MAVSISLSITQNSQSIENNTSNVTVSVTASWDWGSYNATGLCTGSITIDSTKYDFSGLTFNTGETTSGSQVIMTKTVNVGHNSDGSKTLNCSAVFNSRVSSGTVTATKSKTLTTIPRKSSLSASNGTLGTAQTLTVTRKSTSFTHTITYKCGSATGTIVTKSSSTSISWTPPLTLAQQNKTGTTVSVTFTITTYNGNTNVGSDTKTITCSIPASVKPSVSIAVSDGAGLLSTYGAYVQGLSTIEVVVTASGNQGSSISSYSTTADGSTYTAASFTTAAIKNTGTLTISTTVKDSRGRTATASTTISVLAYATPKTTALSAARCNASGAADSSGAYLKIQFSSSVTALNNKNTATYTLRYKKASASSYSSQTLTGYANNYAVSGGSVVIAADTNSSYDLILTVADAFGSFPKATTGSSIKVFWSALGAGDGFAFNKIAENAGEFDVDWVIRARQGILMPDGEGGFIAPAPDGYGLGKTTGLSGGDLNTREKFGLYTITASTLNYPPLIPGAQYGCLLAIPRTDGQVMQEYFNPNNGYRARRWLAAGAWSEWEYINPPMAIDTEYRTTERWNGKVVYAKLINCGTFANAKTVNINSLQATCIVRFESNSAGYPQPFFNGAGTAAATTAYTRYIDVTLSQIKMFGGASVSANTIYATLYYTKD